MLRLAVFATLLLLADAPAHAVADHDSGPGDPSSRRPAHMQVDRTDLPVLVMLIGAGARFRNLHLNVGDGLGGTEGRSFATGAYFDFGWHLLTRPLGRRPQKPAGQAFVIQIDGGVGIGLELEPADSGISLKTNSWRILGQTGYLHPIGRLRIGGLVGAGGDVLRIDLNSVLPSSRIVFLRIGAALAYDIVPGFLGVRTDFGLRVPFFRGSLEDAFGSNGSGVGLDASLSFGGKLRAGFSYALRLIWAYYRPHFTGSTSNVPAMGDGAQGNDHAVTLQFLLGWSL